MENPWLQLPDTAPYVLSEDSLSVQTFNHVADLPVRVETGLLPEPWVGSLDARVVLLALNPGYSEGDAAQHAEPAFRTKLFGCLHGQLSSHPFYHLDPEVNGPGAEWWRRALKGLTDKMSLERVTRGLLCLEFFPYHSRKFDHAHLRLRSQEYTFQLLRAAMQRNAPIIVTRGLKYWLGAVPELQEYGRRFVTRNWQRTSISSGNCPDGWETICRVLLS